MTSPVVLGGLPDEAVTSLGLLVEAVGGEVVLVGGWAVRLRLHCGRVRGRATEDLDVLVPHHRRPAAEALRAASLIQGDSAHRARLRGLPLLVDLLSEPSLVSTEELVRDDDGLVLPVPPAAALMSRSARAARLVSGAGEVVVGLPSAGALFAGKVGNLGLGLERRPIEKQRSDALDALLLVTTFSVLGVLQDLDDHATAQERTLLRETLKELGPGGLAVPARDAGSTATREQVSAALEALLPRL